MSYINNYPFVLIFFLCVIVFVFFGIIFKAKIIKKIFIVFSSFFFALFVTEMMLSFYMQPIIMKPIELYNKRSSYFPQKGNSYQVSEVVLDNGDRDWFLVDKNYYKTKSNFAENNDIVIETIYTLDENGLRTTKSNDESKDAYLFLGCSFMFGACINDNETLPYLFSEKFNFERKVINAGQDARGINRAYSILANRDYLKGLIGKSQLKYVFYEFIEDHINRAFRYNMPSDVLIYENKKEYEVNQPFKFVKKVFTSSLIFERCLNEFIEAKSFHFYIKYINNTFRKMYNISKEYYGADFVVVMWDRNKDIEDYFIENNIDFIKAYKILNYEKDIVEFDGHPNIKGNKKMVGLITDFINEKGEI